MAQKTKSQLKSTLVDGHVLTGEDCTDLVDSLKGVQTPVTDPTASGTSTAFIASITQDAEGRIVVTKKTVNFSGYLPNTALNNYQNYDTQVVGDIAVVERESQEIVHDKKHYPTVRLINEEGVEVDSREYNVKHINTEGLIITLGESLTGKYKYILD